MSLCPLPGYLLTLCYAPRSTDWYLPHSREDPITPTAVIQALFRLHPEPWQPSPSMFPPSLP